MASSNDVPAPAPAAPTDAHQETARSAGRGGLAIAVAKVSFIVFGFAQQLVLPHLVGEDGYGQLRRVFGIIGIVNNVIVGTAIQGVSRSVSSVPEAEADQAFRKTLWMHVVVAVAVSLGFALLSETLAEEMSASHVAGPLKLVAIVPLFYGIYAPLVGSLNGKRRFMEQAGLDIGYGALRLAATVAGAILFKRAGMDAVVGAVLGFTAAAALIVPLAGLRAGTGSSGPAGPTVRAYSAFLGPLMLAQLFLNLLLQTDMFLLSRFVGEAGGVLGLPVKESDVLVGAYGMAQLFAFLPYQMLISISFVLFPMLSRAHSEQDAAAIARYTATGVRIALVIAGLMCGTVAALGPHVIRFAFSEAAAMRGGEALRVLALGMGAFAVLGIVSAALTSLKREGLAALLTAATVVAVAVGSVLLVPNAPFGPAMLMRSATAVALAMGLAAVVGGLVLRRISGAFTSPLTIVRVLAATAITVAVGSRLPWLGKLMVVPEAIGLGILYLAVLALLREIGRADLVTLQQAFGRRRR